MIYIEGFTGWEEQTLCLTTEQHGARELALLKMARFRIERRERGLDDILDADLRDEHEHYRVMSHLLLVETTIAAECRRLHGHSSKGLIGHNAYRGFREFERWWTLRDAIANVEHPVEPVKPVEPGEEEQVIDHIEDIEGVVVWDQETRTSRGAVNYAPPGDALALARIFGFEPDAGDMREFRNGDKKWRTVIDRMKLRAA